jgi:flavin reductase (DIM6/NTAB) family NADH-FMN oxidoreductase RutF
MDPPSMCVAVNRSASIHPILATSKSFCVNLLRAGQTDLVSAFSRADRRHMRFASGTWLWAHGLPYLESALGAVFCESRASVDFGTHTLHVGAVIGLADLGTGSPLVWHDGGYACLNRAAN